MKKTIFIGSYGNKPEDLNDEQIEAIKRFLSKYNWRPPRQVETEPIELTGLTIGDIISNHWPDKQ